MSSLCVTGPKHLNNPLVLFPGHQQEDGSELEYPGHECQHKKLLFQNTHHSTGPSIFILTIFNLPICQQMPFHLLTCLNLMLSLLSYSGHQKSVHSQGRCFPKDNSAKLGILRGSYQWCLPSSQERAIIFLSFF